MSYIHHHTKNTREVKDASITIRCTSKEKEMIERKAKSVDKSTSEYLIDCGMAGLERRRDKDRRRMRQMVENTEAVNEFYCVLQKQDTNSELYEYGRKILEGESKQWQYY